MNWEFTWNSLYRLWTSWETTQHIFDFMCNHSSVGTYCSSTTAHHDTWTTWLSEWDWRVPLPVWREGECEIAVREKGFLLQGCVLLQCIGATNQGTFLLCQGPAPFWLEISAVIWLAVNTDCEIFANQMQKSYNTLPKYDGQLGKARVASSRETLRLRLHCQGFIFQCSILTSFNLFYNCCL